SVLLGALDSFPTRRSSDLADGGGEGRSVGIVGGHRAEVPAVGGLLVAEVERLVVEGGLADGSNGGCCAVQLHPGGDGVAAGGVQDRKSTRLNSSHVSISYA